MSDSSAMDFGKFIPSFDFLQNLSQAQTSTLQSFASWAAPTLNIEDIEKRIQELKTVQFWLEQNTRALAATVQALEVQRMTLATLKGMKLNVHDLSQTFPFATPQSQEQDTPSTTQTTAVPPAPASSAQKADSTLQEPSGTSEESPPSAQAAGIAQAMQWWGALTQQFQQITQQALQDSAQQSALLQATQMGADLSEKAAQTANDLLRPNTAQRPAPKAATPKPVSARKSTASKTSAKKASTKAKAAPKSTPSRSEGAAPKTTKRSKPRT